MRLWQSCQEVKLRDPFPETMKEEIRVAEVLYPLILFEKDQHH